MDEIIGSIFLSAALGNVKYISDLIDNGCHVDSICGNMKINGQGVEGFTPLMIAISQMHSIKAIECLLTRGANVNYQEPIMAFTPLMVAVSHNSKNSMDVINLLVENQADINQQDAAGQTAAMHAIFQDGDDIDLKIVNLLLDKGCDVELTDKRNRKLIDVARERGRFDAVDLIQSYVDNKSLNQTIFNSINRIGISF